VQIDVILFDWGGTLAEVARQDESLQRGVREAVRLMDGSPNGLDAGRLIEAILGAEQQAAADPAHREADLKQVVAQWARSLGVRDHESIKAACDVLGRAWIGCLDLVPGVDEALTRLRDCGYRMGLVSNCSVNVPYCFEELERLGLTGLLDFFVISSMVGYRKPSAVIYEAALKEAFPEGWPEDLSKVLFVGDSPSCDIIAPAERGMKTALVKCKKGLWPQEDYDKARPDFQIDSVTELPSILCS